MENVGYALLSVFVVSLVSVVFAIPFLIKKRVSDKTLLILLSVSVGVLLATVFFDFIPEIYDHSYENHFLMPVYILIGFFVMFIIEKMVHFHHKEHCEGKNCGHSHAYSIAPLNLIGDGVHNLIDGLVIAGAYAVSAYLGLVATISIIFHEIPQEIADFGVLLYSGLSKKKALFYNFLSALLAIVGTFIGIFVFGATSNYITFIIPFAAGNFLYIAASNLLPELHRHCKFKESIVHIIAILVGILIMVFTNIMFPHTH